jgi:hypothetical protein
LRNDSVNNEEDDELDNFVSKALNLRKPKKRKPMPRRLLAMFSVVFI